MRSKRKAAVFDRYDMPTRLRELFEDPIANAPLSELERRAHASEPSSQNRDWDGR